MANWHCNTVFAAELETPLPKSEVRVEKPKPKLGLNHKLDEPVSLNVGYATSLDTAFDFRD